MNILPRRFRPGRLVPLFAVLIAASAMQPALRSSATADAAVTAADRREISAIGRLISKAALAVRRRKTEDATKLLQEAEERLKAVQQKTQLPDDSLVIKRLREGIQRQRMLLDRQTGKNGGSKTQKAATGVSFSKQVAPILAARCLNCHGQRASGGLRLLSYADMKRGGKSGPLLIPGLPQRSLIIARLLSPTNRMPKSGPPLAPAELQTIAAWIQQGARFDGPNEAMPLPQLIEAVKNKGMGDTKKKEEPPIQIAKATGNEKVSFVNDIAPTLVNICLRCHSGKDPAGGLSMETFEKLMRGGDSGRVLIPGNVEGSRLFRLVGARELPRMPQGQARITRKWFADLQTWIREGLKYDGDDPKKPLRELVPTEEEKRAMELAKLSPEEFAKLREERTQQMWKRAAPNDAAQWLRTKEFYLYGNVSPDRLKQIGDWAEEYAQKLREMFPIQGDRIWRGRLAIIVFRDRFGYSEFNITIENREVPDEVTGHARVTPTFEEAYIVLQDVGDTADTTTGGMRVNLIDQLTVACLGRSGAKLPEWVTRGTGLAMAARVAPAPSYFNALRERAKNALQTANLRKPEEIFAKGKFSPGDIAAVGYTLVEFMLRNGGADRFGRFVTALQRGDSPAVAVKTVYPPADLSSLARAYLASLAKTK
ncbi:MAG: hypothetical protein D6725_17795 [Planctomycetota bacterium]|nr:MAG: hypothetical protein D6725_17795 [Planctomycetota bacterium]